MSAPDGEGRAAGRRRGSWARALERFKMVIRRKDTNQEEARAAVPEPSITNRASLSALFDPPVLEPEAATENNAPTQDAQHRSIAPTTQDNIDAAIEEPDQTEEPLLAPNLGFRTGLSDEKARILFEKYGLKYQGGRPAAEILPSRAQRVEKPIRIRIHWRCHECRVAFGQDMTCASCGHRKCTQCIREPPKKIVQLLENPRHSREVVAESSANVPRPSVNSGVAERTVENAASATRDTAPCGLSTAPLEQDEDEETDTAEPATFLYSFEARGQPGAGTRLVHRPKAQLVRRVCHECSAAILPASRPDCQKCGHMSCSLCPRYPRKAGKHATAAAASAADPQTKPAATVERVYRKPRQRVRWTCDKCQSPFAERDRCGNCAHERCEHCIRSPPRKEQLGPDPAVYYSVQEKLAAFAAQREQLQSVAVTS